MSESETPIMKARDLLGSTLTDDWQERCVDFVMHDLAPLLEGFSSRTADARKLASAAAMAIDGKMSMDDPWPGRVDELCVKLRKKGFLGAYQSFRGEDIPQQPQRHDTLENQLADIRVAALRLGMYDVATWIERCMDEYRLPMRANTTRKM